MKMKNTFLAVSASLVLLLLTACNAPAPQAMPSPVPTQPAVVLPSNTLIPRYYFVTNKLLLPTTQAQTQAYALNIDEDPQGQPDNLFGNLLTMLVSAAPGLELQSTVDQAINSGQIVTLHALQANNLMNDPNASWSIFLGLTAPSAPSFDGADKFALDSATPANSQVIGSLTNGHFVGGPGAVRVRMVILGSPVAVNLIGVRLEADASEKGCFNGKLGGGITVDEFRSQLLPALTDGLNRIIKADKSIGNTILSVFDADQNGVISSSEIENNILLKLVIAPDLDLLDASGKFNPRQDGVNDSLSIGLSFTCVPATFAVPGD